MRGLECLPRSVCETSHSSAVLMFLLFLSQLFLSVIPIHPTSVTSLSNTFYLLSIKLCCFSSPSDPECSLFSGLGECTEERGQEEEGAGRKSKK